MIFPWLSVCAACVYWAYLSIFCSYSGFTNWNVLRCLVACPRKCGQNNKGKGIFDSLLDILFRVESIKIFLLAMSKQVPWLGMKYLPKVSWSFMISLTLVNFLKIRFFLAAMLFVLGRARRDSACSFSATSTLLNKDSVQQKVRADSLPHVVCLKCDPNGVTGFLGGGLDTSEQINHISSVKTNLQYTVCTCIVIFNTTCPTCIVKKLTGSGGGEALIESILCICKAWCYLKTKNLVNLHLLSITRLRSAPTTGWDWDSARGWCRMKARELRRSGACPRLEG